MIEISFIRDGQVTWEKEFKSYKEHLETLKNKTPNKAKIVEMENKFLELVKSDKAVANYYKIAVGIGVSLTTNTTFAYADTLGGVSERLKVIISPIIELLAGLGYPAAYGMLITGFIMVIMGKKHKGIEIIKWACIGYIGLQFVPFLLSLLEMIGIELRNSL